MGAKHYIAIIGRIGAGKETVFQTIKGLLPEGNVTIHHSSDPLNETLDLWHLDRSRYNQQTVSRILRETFGQNLLAEVMRHRAQASLTPIVIIDGIRRPDEVTMLRRLPGSTILAVTASLEVRYERIKSRNSRTGDAVKTWEQFQREDQAESEQLIEAICREADQVIDNSGSLEQLDLDVQSWLTTTLGLTIR